MKRRGFWSRVRGLKEFFRGAKERQPHHRKRVMGIEPLERRQLLSVTPTVTLTSSANPSILDHAVTLTATLPANATGSVAFSDGETSLGSAVPLTPAPVTEALQFDGASGYVDLGDSASQDLGANVTVSAWIRIDGEGAGNGIDLIKQNETGTTGASYGLVYLVSTGKISFSLATTNNSWCDYPSTTSISTGTWYHVAGVYDGSSVKVYLNGQLDASYEGVSGDLIEATGHLLIGKEDAWEPEYVAGAVDEVGIWNTALGDSQIEDVYQIGYGDLEQAPWDNGLIAGYHFDEGSDSTVHDFSLHDNDGTLSSTGVSWIPSNVPYQRVSITTQDLGFGDHAITATYDSGDDPNYTDATSNTIDQQVKFAASVGLTSSENPSAYGQNVTFTAVVPGDATGTVDFNVDDETEYTEQLPGNTSPSYGLQFDGTSDYATMPEISGVNSVSFWFNADATQDAPLVYAGANEYNSGYWQWGVWLDSDSNINFCAYPWWSQGQISYTPGTWNHVVLVRNDNGDAKFYVNGSLATTVAGGSGSGDDVIGLGAAGGNHFAGKIDELQLYNTALSSSDVTYLRGTGAFGQSTNTGLIAGYHLDGDLSDFTTNGNGGTLYGNATWVPGIQTVSYTTSNLALGSHSITASYSGDGNYEPADSDTLVQEVKKSATVDLTSSSDVCGPDEEMTFSARVPDDATGTITLMADGSALATDVSLPAPSVDLSQTALVMRGSNYVTLGTGTITTGPTTLSFWFQHTEGSDFLAELKIMQSQGAFVYIGDGDVPGTQRAYIDLRGSTGESLGTGNFTPTPWTHVAITYNGGNVTDPTSFTIYVNDTSMPLSPVGFNGGSTGTNMIGNVVGGSPFTGALDEFLIFNKALNSTQVGELYNGGAGVYGDVGIGGLAAGFHFDGNATDFVPGGPSGTLEGTTDWMTGAVMPMKSVELATVTLPMGRHKITACYSGDTNYAPRVSDQLLQTVAINVDEGDTHTISGITGSQPLLKIGGGTLVLTGTNDYTGRTEIDGGTLQIGEAGALPEGTNLTVYGTLDLGGYDATVGALWGAGIVDTTSGTPTLTIGGGNASSTFDGLIENSSGTVVMVKTGAGTITLTSANTYGGTTDIQAGTLIAATTDSLSGWDTGNVTTEGGATLGIRVGGWGEWNSGTHDDLADLLASPALGDGAFLGIDTTDGDFSYDGLIADTEQGTLGLTKLGSGTLILSRPCEDPNSYSEGTNIRAGMLEAKTTAALPGWNSSGIAVARDAILAVRVGGTGEWNSENDDIAALLASAAFADGARLGVDTTDGPFSYSTAINDTAEDAALGLAKLGDGKLTLTGTNGYTGGMRIYGGTLAINDDAALGNTAGPLAFYGDATLQPDAVDLVLSSNRLMEIVSAGIRATIDTQAQIVEIPGQITGPGGLTKTGSGKLILGGDNDFSGGATLKEGTLQLDSTSALGVGPAAALPPAVTINGGTLDLDGNSITIGSLAGYGGIITDSSEGGVTTTLTVDQADYTTFAGDIQNGDTELVALVKRGTGTLALYGNNVYTGGTTVAAGTLQAATTAALSGYDGSNSLYVATGATLVVNVGSATDWQAADVDLVLGIAALNSWAFLGLDTTDGDFSYPIPETYPLGGELGLIKLGENTLTLTAENDYSGDTIVLGGTLAISADSALGTGTLTLDGGMLKITDDGFTSSRPITLGQYGGTIDTNGHDATLSGVISGLGGLTKMGEGILVLAGENTYNGGMDIEAGTVQLSSGSALGAVQDSYPALTITGGTLDLHGHNLALGWLGGGADAIITDFANGSTVILTVYQAYDSTFAGSITEQTECDSIALIKDGPGRLTLTGTNDYTAGTTVTAGTLQAAKPDALADYASGSVSVLEGATLALNVGGTGEWSTGESGDIETLLGNATFDTGSYLGLDTSTNTAGASTSLNLAGNFTLAKLGQNTLTLESENDCAAVTVLAGTLAISDDSALGTGSLTLDGGTLKILTDDFDSTRNITLGAGGGTIDTNGNDTALSGVISGGGDLTKTGSGTLTLSNAETYTGQTTVNDGELDVTGSLLSSVVVVSPGTVSGAPVLLGADDGSVSVTEGDTAEATGTWQPKVTGEDVSLFADWGTVTKNNDNTWSWSGTAGDGSKADAPVTIYAVENGQVVSLVFHLAVTNSGPASLSIDAGAATIGEWDTTTLTGTFTDPGANEVRTVTINWHDGESGGDDIETLTLAAGALTFQSAPHQFPGPGTYDDISVTVSDGVDTTSAVTTSVTVDYSVTIGADIPSASEVRVSNGEFLLTLDAAPTSAVRVHYTAGGSAVEGTDYDFNFNGASHGTDANGWWVEFGTGVTQVALDVVPLGTTLTGGSATVIVELSSGTGYSHLDVFNEARVTIWDDDRSTGSDPVVAQLTLYKSDGTADVQTQGLDGGTSQAVLGDFIPLGVQIVSGDRTGKTFTLDYDDTKIKITSDVAGENVIASGTVITLTTSDTIYFVWGAHPEDGEEEDGEISVGEIDGEEFSTGATMLCSLDADEKPLELYRDGVDITDDKDGSANARRVPIGQRINLSIGGPAVADSADTPYTEWFVDKNVIADYIANKNEGTKVPFDINQGKAAIQFVWADGGNKHVKAVAAGPYGSETVWANFIVDQPNVVFDASTYQKGKNSAEVLRLDDTLSHVSLGRVVATGAKPPARLTKPVEPGITFQAKHLDASWEYCWVQVATLASRYDPRDENAHYYFETPENTGLDDVFPYAKCNGAKPATDDTPGFPIDKGEDATYDFSATMWLMCRPDENGVWVPLQKLKWSWLCMATYDSEAKVTSSLPVPTKSAVSMAAINDFPEWTKLLDKNLKYVSTE